MRGSRWRRRLIRLCTDNAVMVAWAALERLRLGLSDPLDTPPRPRWPLAELTGAPDIVILMTFIAACKTIFYTIQVDSCGLFSNFCDIYEYYIQTLYQRNKLVQWLWARFPNVSIEEGYRHAFLKKKGRKWRQCGNFADCMKHALFLLSVLR